MKRRENRTERIRDAILRRGSNKSTGFSNETLFAISRTYIDVKSVYRVKVFSGASKNAGIQTNENGKNSETTKNENENGRNKERMVGTAPRNKIERTDSKFHGKNGKKKK